MTSIGTSTESSIGCSVSDLIGRRGLGEFGKKNPKWYSCVVKKDNNDGTIKVQWDEGKKFTKRLPIEKFRLEDEPVHVHDDIKIDNIFGNNDDGDY
mmetsp:Transcript_6382/g.9821  ORF Transcript_6382/g.9821 Transcript_6382/m.9821 type:complete len:96 (+) Transcript_6382:82-369(+)|eukprot:CAMPEP_0178935816 /NCGR_PEP_ID=MMETSP0786-20121207/24768_1 /TAXON_ID=186022 /ORGANISM="Thalassionema frauenfeldii, Strain CCMP 1798" /LENGTH=95 /DNA_ID=CAMNT_0020614031 /DNA_START=172 /DNA_END=459 /DNA_ORIENTATION=+